MHYYHLRLRYRALSDLAKVDMLNVADSAPWTEFVICAALPWPIEYASDVRAVEGWCGTWHGRLGAELLAWTPLAGDVRPGVEPRYDLDVKVMPV